MVYVLWLFVVFLARGVLAFIDDTGIDADPTEPQPPFRCPRGYYAPRLPPPQKITGTNMCKPCPRGKYGSSRGMTTSDCTANCPAGKYGPKKAATTEADCEVCPPGTYGSTTGLTSRTCTASCLPGKYSLSKGVTSDVQCLECPPNYRGAQCNFLRRGPEIDNSVDMKAHRGSRS
jgi:hypothetical protein